MRGAARAGERAASRRRGTKGVRRRRPRACGAASRHPDDAQARACTQPRGRMPERSVRAWRSCRQASSGAMRRCRRPKCRHMPAGVLDSLRAPCRNAGAKGAAPRWQPTVAGLDSTRPTDAAPEAPRKRKVRKFDSLSTAAMGPTKTNLAPALDARQSKLELRTGGVPLRRFAWRAATNAGFGGARSRRARKGRKPGLRRRATWRGGHRIERMQ